MTQRSSVVLAFAGLLVAAFGAIGVAAGEGTRLGFGDLDPWLVVYAVGLFIALGSAPYGLFDRYADKTDDKDAR